MLCAEVLFLAPLAAEHRVALVIGNGKYPNTPLINPPNDAADMAKSLEKLDFTVIKGINADYREMISYIRDFQNMLNEPDTIALFYYSGHGVQVSGKNYLIPAEADIQNIDEVEAMSVQTDLIYNKLQNGNVKTRIIILDACRNNPFPGAERSTDRGLSVQGKFPSQSIIVYATGPNQTAKDGSGRNGTFTASLLKHLDDPMDIELMLRSVRDEVSKATGGEQIPWTNSSLTGGFSFIEGAATVAYRREPASPVTLSLSGLPPETTVSIDGKTYLTAMSRDETEVGKFIPGDYTLSLSGPYLEAAEILVSLEADKPLVLTPEIQELGKLKIQATSASVNYSIEGLLRPVEWTGPTDNTTFWLDPGKAWEDSVPSGDYILQVHRIDDPDYGYTQQVTIAGSTEQTLQLPKIGYSEKWHQQQPDRINAVKEKKVAYEQQLAKIPGQQRTAKTVGRTSLLIGGAFSAVAITAGILGLRAYSNYKDAAYSSDADTYRDEAKNWSLIMTGSAITAGVSFLISPIAFLAAPKPDKIEAAIQRLDEEIAKLSQEGDEE